MDVSVPSNPGQRSLRSAAKAGLLGSGLLERARSTTLALLGMAAAVGLATVALALNQDWPLIPGAPVPGLGGGHEAVGQAVSVAGPGARAPRATPLRSVGAPSPANRPGGPGGRHRAATVVKGARAPKGVHLAVSAPTSVNPSDGPAANEAPDPLPASPQSSPAQPTEPVVASVPAGSSAPTASAPPSQAAPESPITSKTPPADDENDQGAGRDRGHRYGEGAGRGHGHSRGGDDADAEEAGESPVVAPATSDGSPPESEPGEPEDSADDHPHESSWGHGHGHGHSHW